MQIFPLKHARVFSSCNVIAVLAVNVRIKQVGGVFFPRCSCEQFSCEVMQALGSLFNSVTKLVA